MDALSSPSYCVAYSFGRTSSVVFSVFGRCAPELITRMHRRRKEVRKGHPFPGLREGPCVRGTAQFTLARITTDRMSRHRQNLEAQGVCVLVCVYSEVPVLNSHKACRTLTVLSRRLLHHSALHTSPTGTTTEAVLLPWPTWTTYHYRIIFLI